MDPGKRSARRPCGFLKRGRKSGCSCEWGHPWLGLYDMRPFVEIRRLGVGLIGQRRC